MKALVKEGPEIEGVELKSIEKPVPSKDEIRVKIIAAGICGTDIHIMEDEFECCPPVVMGHEFVGVVDELGEGVKGFKKGNKIVSLTAAETCGSCLYCDNNLLMLCNERLSIGSGLNGAFAEYMVIPAKKSFLLPKNITDAYQYAITEPFACVVRGVIERTRISAGDIVLISGPGTIGLLSVQMAKLQGAYVIVSGIPGDEKRLELARKLGADEVVSRPDNLGNVVRNNSNYGVDVAFECSGAVSSIESCLNNLKKQGIYSQLGLFGNKVLVDMDEFLYKEIKITNSFASEPSSWDRALRLIENKQVKLEPLISAQIPLDDWEKGFEMFRDKESFKVLLKP